MILLVSLKIGNCKVAKDYERLRKMRLAQLFAICASSADFVAYFVDIIVDLVFSTVSSRFVYFTKWFGVFDGFASVIW